MKSLFSLFLALMLFQPLAFADSEKYCEPGAKLTEKLGLEENQVDPVQQIMKEQHEKRREIFQANREALKNSMSALHNETKERLSSVLTPEQLQKFEEMHAQKMEKMKQRGEKWKKRQKEYMQDVSTESKEAEAI